MTARSIRRAAERKARKTTEKKARLQNLAPHENETPFCPSSEDSLNSPVEHKEAETEGRPQPSSEARLAANRLNSQLSTGPRSAEGKALSSLNAVTTALTGRTVLLPSDDVIAYEQHVASYEKEFQPAGGRETELVQSIADAQWRLMRIPALEMAIYARGRSEFAQKFESEEPALRPSIIDLETFLAYQKPLRNLQLQEGRLRRQREKDLAELRSLQEAREEREKEQLALASKLYLAARHDRRTFAPADHGFEFSTSDIEAYLEGARVAQIANAALRNAA